MVATMNGKAVTNQEKALKLSASGLTNREIGEELGVSEATASRWVNEQRSIELEELARALNATKAALDKMKADREDMQAALAKANEEAEAVKAAFNKAQSETATLKASLTDAKEQAAAMNELREALNESESTVQEVRQMHESACEELSTLRQELASFQQTKQHLSHAQAQLAKMREEEANRKRAWLINLFQGNNFMTLIVLVGGISLAAAITAPIFMSVGVAEIPAYAMAIYVDIACFIFVLNNRHRLGVGFSIATALQALIKLGGLHWMQPDGLIIVKAAVLAVALGLATYGFSDLIASKKSTH